jgi:hypothetical protein
LIQNFLLHAELRVDEKLWLEFFGMKSDGSSVSINFYRKFQNINKVLSGLKKFDFGLFSIDIFGNYSNL